mmetsp:Transcript_43460/g.52688  ORF Transcript_43460/g.52688 Transcript_43460/m.52688 type:complete len:81 (-) Transcript_43460:13-255(-)
MAHDPEILQSLLCTRGHYSSITIFYLGGDTVTAATADRGYEKVFILQLRYMTLTVFEVVCFLLIWIVILMLVAWEVCYEY